MVNTLSKMFSPLFGVNIDPNKEVLVTVGAYGSLFCSIHAFIDEGDEVFDIILLVMFTAEIFSLMHYDVF